MYSKDGESAEMRLALQHEAYEASMERAGQLLRNRGWESDELGSAQLFDLPSSTEKAALLQRRDDLGLSTDPEAYLMSDPMGVRIAGPGMAAHRQFWSA